jgi:hypothetical protein
MPCVLRKAALIPGRENADRVPYRKGLRTRWRQLRCSTTRATSHPWCHERRDRRSVERCRGTIPSGCERQYVVAKGGGAFEQTNAKATRRCGCFTSSSSTWGRSAGRLRDSVGLLDRLLIRSRRYPAPRRMNGIPASNTLCYANEICDAKELASRYRLARIEQKIEAGMAHAVRPKSSLILTVRISLRWRTSTCHEKAARRKAPKLEGRVQTNGARGYDQEHHGASCRPAAQCEQTHAAGRPLDMMLKRGRPASCWPLRGSNPRRRNHCAVPHLRRNRRR